MIFSIIFRTLDTLTICIRCSCCVLNTCHTTTGKAVTDITLLVLTKITVFASDTDAVWTVSLTIFANSVFLELVMVTVY